MASDLISRSKLLESFKRDFKPTLWEDKYIVQNIMNAPSVDAETVRHGEWEWLGPNSMVSGCMCGTCSVCKVRSKYIVNVGICPNCGAKMDGGKQDA